MGLTSGLLACTSEDDGGPAPVPGGETKGPDLNPRPMQAWLELTVKEANARQPVAQAGVVVDTLDGNRLEGVTDNTGKARLKVSYDKVKAVVIHKDGYIFEAFSGDTLRAQKAKDWKGVLTLHKLQAPVEPKKMARVHGFAEGVSDDSMLTVTSTIAGSSWHVGEGNKFVIDVPAEKAFSLIAMEWKAKDSSPKRGFAFDITQFQYKTSKALPQGAVIPNFNLASKHQPTIVEGSFKLPQDSLGKTGAVFMWVRSAESGAILGAPTQVSVSADGKTANYKVSFMEGDDYAPVTTFIVARGDSYSMAQVAHYPREGVADVELFEVPAEPTGTLADGVSWKGAATGYDSAGVVVFNSKGQQIVTGRRTPS